MEHDEKPLPIDIRLLGALAEKVCFLLSSFWNFTICLKNNLSFYQVCFMLSSSIICFLYFYIINMAFQCRAFAKALHYKEMEFEGARSKKMDANPVAVVEALIHINNQLHQHEVYYKETYLFESLLFRCYFLSLILIFHFYEHVCFLLIDGGLFF